MQPGGRLLGQQVGEPGDDRLDGRGLGVGDGAAVAGQLEVGQHPAHGVELGPRVGRPVGHRQPADEAVLLGAEARRAGRWVAASARPKSAAASVLFLPGSIHAMTRHSWSTPSTSGTCTPPSTSPSQRSPAASRSKKSVGGVRQRLHQRRGAVAEPQLGRGRDVTAGDGGGGHDRGAEQLLGVAGDQRLAGHSRVPRAARRQARRRCARPCPAPPRNRCRHRSTGRAPRHRVRRERGRSRGRADPTRVDSDAADTSRRFWASIASTRSCSSSQDARTAGRGAGWRRSRRRSAWPPPAGPSGGRRASRRCRSWRPSPGRRARRRRACAGSTTSAIGERQMLPRQTSATE